MFFHFQIFCTAHYANCCKTVSVMVFDTQGEKLQTRKPYQFNSYLELESIFFATFYQQDLRNNYIIAFTNNTCYTIVLCDYVFFPNKYKLFTILLLYL